MKMAPRRAMIWLHLGKQLLWDTGPLQRLQNAASDQVWGANEAVLCLKCRRCICWAFQSVVNHFIMCFWLQSGPCKLIQQHRGPGTGNTCHVEHTKIQTHLNTLKLKRIFFVSCNSFFFPQRSDLCMVCACMWAGGSGVCTSFVVVVLVFLLNELASKPRDLPGSTSSSASSLTGLHRAIPSICVSPGIRTLVLKHS